MIRRSVALFAALLTVSCASSTLHGLSIGIKEVRQPGRPLPIVGNHYYIIRIRNTGTEPVIVNTITIAPSGMTEIDVETATERFGEAVNEGQEVRFEMLLTVLNSRGAEDPITKYIQSLRVTIGGQGPHGTFVDSGDYPVGVEVPEG